MGKAYVQLSLEDRCEIARRRAEGQSIRQIAAALDRAPSSIARELKRNTGRKVGYQPAYANAQTRARRWTGSRLSRRPELQKVVLDRLAQGWSPEQVAGRIAREAAPERVSYETIYRFIYDQIRRTQDYSWRLYLPRAKSRRGIRGVRGGSPASFIQQRVAIDLRDPEVQARTVPGHWEADLVMFAKYGQALLTLHERTSRIVLATRPANKTADLIAEIMRTLLEPLPEALRRTVTFDNGTEFARHYRLHDLGFKTYFCDPHAPWQKGGIENAIGRLRRTLPRKTDLATLSHQRFAKLLRAYNSTPRKCLDFQTPAEIFLAQLLHFGCEST
ncbi:MAG: IS30 family transposase, partial [Anaerolineales bacterium]|nr:IS30 family transposase [Anaerolineales bacterium]